MIFCFAARPKHSFSLTSKESAELRATYSERAKAINRETGNQANNSVPVNSPPERTQFGALFLGDQEYPLAQSILNKSIQKKSLVKLCDQVWKQDVGSVCRADGKMGKCQGVLCQQKCDLSFCWTKCRSALLPRRENLASGLTLNILRLLRARARESGAQAITPEKRHPLILIRSGQIQQAWLLVALRFKPLTCFGWKASLAADAGSEGTAFDLCFHIEGGRRVPTIHSHEQIVEKLAGSSHDLTVDYALPSYQVSWHSALGRLFASEPHWVPMTVEEALAVVSEGGTPPQSDDDGDDDDGSDAFLAKLKKAVGKTGGSDMVSVNFF